MEKENNASETKKWPPTKKSFCTTPKFLADGQMNELRQSGEKVCVQSKSFYQIRNIFRFGLDSLGKALGTSCLT